MTNFNFGTWVKLLYFKWRHFWGNNLSFRLEGWVELARGGAGREKSPLRRVNKQHIGPEVGEHLQWPLHVAWSSHSVVASFWEGAPSECSRRNEAGGKAARSGSRHPSRGIILIAAIKNLDQCQWEGKQALTLDSQHACTRTGRVIRSHPGKITMPISAFSKSNWDLS